MRSGLCAHTGALLLAAAAAVAAQDADGDPPSSYLVLYEFASQDAELDTAQLDLLVGEYAERLAREIEEIVGSRGHVSQEGLTGIAVQLEDCSPEEIADVLGLGPRPGRSGLCFVADEFAPTVEGVDHAAARAALARRLEEHAGHGPDEVDVSDLALQTGSERYRWVPYTDAVLAGRREGSLDFSAQPLGPDDYELLAFDASGEPLFSPADFRSVGLGEGFRGERVVSVKMREDRVDAFGDFTGARVGDNLAILVDDRVLTEPARVHNRLGEFFVIQSGRVGGFSREEVVASILDLQLSGGLLTRTVVEEGPAPEPIRIGR